VCDVEFAGYRRRLKRAQRARRRSSDATGLGASDGSLPTRCPAAGTTSHVSLRAYLTLIDQEAEFLSTPVGRQFKFCWIASI
jgi:hypothetical protein